MTDTSIELKAILTLASALYVAQLATYPAFFIFNPFASQINIALSIAQTFLLLMWPLIAVAFPIIFLARKRLGNRAKTLLRICAVGWPVGLALVHFILFVLARDPALGYLLQYPTFVLTDLLVPAIYWQLARRVSD